MPDETQLAKWGNSLAVRIPRTIVKEAGWAEGDQVSFDVAKDGSIVLRSRYRKYSLDQFVAGIKPANPHSETDWGPRRGKEAW